MGMSDINASTWRLPGKTHHSKPRLRQPYENKLPGGAWHHEAPFGEFGISLNLAGDGSEGRLGEFHSAFVGLVISWLSGFNPRQVMVPVELCEWQKGNPASSERPGRGEGFDGVTRLMPDTAREGERF